MRFAMHTNCYEQQFGVRMSRYFCKNVPVSYTHLAVSGKVFPEKEREKSGGLCGYGAFCPEYSSEKGG